MVKLEKLVAMDEVIHTEYGCSVPCKECKWNNDELGQCDYEEKEEE